MPGSLPGGTLDHRRTNLSREYARPRGRWAGKQFPGLSGSIHFGARDTLLGAESYAGNSSSRGGHLLPWLNGCVGHLHPLWKYLVPVPSLLSAQLPANAHDEGPQVMAQVLESLLPMADLDRVTWLLRVFGE